MKDRKLEILQKIKQLESNRESAERDYHAFINSKYKDNPRVDLAKMLIMSCNNKISELYKELEELNLID